MAVKPASTLISTRSPIADKDGMATWSFVKILQEWDTKLRNGLNQIGQITQDIPVATKIIGRSEGIGITVQNLDSNGVMLAPGVDFSRAYPNKDTDHIADGTGSPLNGGKAAQIALVTSPPAPEAHKWVNGFVAGVFTKTQPAFSDIAGTATAAQLPIANTPAVAHQWINSYNSATAAFTQTQPAFSDISSQITTSQLPASGLSVTITTAKLTVGGANGSMTYTNGILTAQVQAT